MKMVWTTEELLAQWTATPEESAMVGKKPKKKRLGMLAQLLFYKKNVCFGNSRNDFAPAVLEHLAEQLGVSLDTLEHFEWAERSGRRHRETIVAFVGFRPFDTIAEKTFRKWLTHEVWPKELNEDACDELITGWFLREKYDRPAPSTFTRVMNSTRHEFDEAVRQQLLSRLDAATCQRLDELLGDGKGDAPLTFVRSDPGRIGLKSVLNQVKKLKRIRELQLPPDVLKGFHADTIKRLRRTSSADSASRLRTHPDRIRWTLVAFECASREASTVDGLVELLLQVINRMMNTAEKRVKRELFEDLERVRGKDALLYRIAEAAHKRPKGKVKDVILPVTDERTWQQLLREAKTKGPYKRKIHTVLRASYGQYYRRMLPRLLEVLDFHSNNDVYKPLIEAIATLRAHVDQKPKFYKVSEITIDDVIRDKWKDIVIETGPDGKDRVNRINYEICVLESLRERVRCRELWVAGAHKFRNPDHDLPSDFATRKEACYKQLGVTMDADAFVEKLRTELKESLTAFNLGYPENKKVRISERRKKNPIILTPLEKQEEPRHLIALKTEVARRWPMTALLDVLKEADMRIGFTQAFQTAATREALTHTDVQARLLLTLYALGTNAGLKRLVAGNESTYTDLLYTKSRYLDKDSLREAARRVVNATLAIRRPDLWGNVTSGCASDSKQFGSYDQNLMTEWHLRYGGRGVMIYWHVEKRSLCIYSQLKRCSSSEVASMIEGVLRHDTDVKVERQYVDTHGQSEVAFAFCYLLGFNLLPRLKAIASQKLYLPEAGTAAEYPHLLPILAKLSIDWDLIRKQLDEMIRYTTALKERTADPDSILLRFTRSNGQHPTYAALAELGKVVKTIFLCRYLGSEELRREIHEGLNVVENWNSANDFVFFGKAGEIATNRLEEQELSVHALHLVQACLVYVNTLMMQRVLEEPKWWAKMGEVELRAVSPLIWAHVSPYGSFELDMEKRLDIEKRVA